MTENVGHEGMSYNRSKRCKGGLRIEGKYLQKLHQKMAARSDVFQHHFQNLLIKMR